MRNYSVLMAFALAFLVLLGLQFLPWQTVGAEASVIVDVDPDTLNLEMHGKWITVYIGPPDGYEVGDIDIGTVKLDGVLSPDRWDVQDDKLMMKFNAEDVISRVWLKIYHMGTPMPQDNVTVELTVTGELNDGTSFEGSDEIQVIAPSL
jgi:hypothetical protein